MTKIIPLLVIVILTAGLANGQMIAGLDESSVDQIKAVAANSPIATYDWNDRGVASIGYFKGMALAYAKSYRELRAQQDSAVSVMSQPLGSKSSDALAWYEKPPGVATDVDRLRALYTLGLGLGMRESSGNTTVGWDKDKLNHGITPTAENSEAGLFQTSWDSRNKSPWLLKLYDAYRADPAQCGLAVFMEKTRDKKEPSFGGGDGAKFQEFNKTCPAFAAEYVMVMLRIDRSHFGPINKKKAEYRSAAEQMFRRVEAIVDKTLQ